MEEGLKMQVHNPFTFLKALQIQKRTTKHFFSEPCFYNTETEGEGVLLKVIGGNL